MLGVLLVVEFGLLFVLRGLIVVCIRCLLGILLV